MQVDSLKKENKKLVAKVNSLQTEFNHVSKKNYISQLNSVTQVNYNMNALLLNKELLRKELNKLERKFAEEEKKMSILGRKLQKYKDRSN